MADRALVRQDNLFWETYLSGLSYELTATGGSAGTRGTNADHVQVSSGATWIPSAGRVVNVPSALRPASNASLSASTRYYLYIYLDGSNNPQVELVTTAPAAPYKGNARAKTADTSRRCVGSLKTDAASRLYNVLRVGTKIAYRETVVSSPFRVLANGLATTYTNVDCSSVTPPWCRMAFIRINNTVGTTAASTTTSDAPSGVSIVDINAGRDFATDHPLDASQVFQYKMVATPTQGIYLDLTGYYEEL